MEKSNRNLVKKARKDIRIGKKIKSTKNVMEPKSNKEVRFDFSQNEICHINDIPKRTTSSVCNSPMGKSCLKNPMISPMKPSPVSLQKSRIRNITGKVCIPKIGKKLNDAVKKSTQASDSHYSFSKSIDDTKSVSESSVSQDSSKKKRCSSLGVRQKRFKRSKKTSDILDYIYKKDYTSPKDIKNKQDLYDRKFEAIMNSPKESDCSGSFEINHIPSRSDLNNHKFRKGENLGMMLKKSMKPKRAKKRGKPRRVFSNSEARLFL